MIIQSDIIKLYQAWRSSCLHETLLVNYEKMCITGKEYGVVNLDGEEFAVFRSSCVLIDVQQKKKEIFLMMNMQGMLVNENHFFFF